MGELNFRENLAELRDSRGTKRCITFSAIQGLCDFLVSDVITTHEQYRKILEEYNSKITRFSSNFEFLIHELGWSIEDSFLSSSGITIDRDNLPLMTDEQIGYSKTLDSSTIDEGIIDELGFISFKNLPNKEFASTIILMQEMIKNERLCNEYRKAKEANPNISNYDFLVGLPNVVGIKRVGDKFELNYAEANVGSVCDFLEYLDVNDLIAERELVTRPVDDLMATPKM